MHRFLLVLLASAVLLPAAEMVGYRGDTTGVFPDAKAPPAGRVRWAVPLPNWSYSFPIVVDGRVFCLSEPGWQQTFPLLLCFDADSGEERWRLELDHLPFTDLPPARQEEMRAEMARRWEWWRKTWSESGGTSPHKTKTKPPWAKRGHQGPPMNEHGLYAGTWWDWGMALIGHTFPTPVSDGEHVYVATTRGTLACVDLAGKLVWLTRIPYQDYRGEDCRNARSPILSGDKLICANGTSVRFYDKRSGQEVTRVETGAGHTVATPVFITLGDHPFIYTCVNTFISLETGKQVPLEGGVGEGIHTPTVDDEHDIIFFTGNGEHCSFTHSKKGKGLGMPAAVKFELQGQKIRGEILWQNSKDRDKRENHPPLYHRGRLYCGNTIFDALTGKVLAKGGKHNRVVPETKHVLLTDGRHVFGLDAAWNKRKNEGGPGVLAACTLDGEPAGRVELPYTEVLDPARCKAKMGKPDWGFSRSCPFTLAGGRIYVRGFDALYCIE